MLPLSGHLERAGLGCDSKRVDYRGQFLAGCIKRWCNVTALSGSCMLTTSTASALRWNHRGSNYQLCMSAGLDTVTTLNESFCCFTRILSASALSGVMDFPNQRETWAERTSYVVRSGGSKSWRGKGGGWWYFPACSPILKHRCSLHAALSAFEHTPPPSPNKSWLLWICLFPTCDLHRWGSAKC